MQLARVETTWSSGYRVVLVSSNLICISEINIMIYFFGPLDLTNYLDYKICLNRAREQACMHCVHSCESMFVSNVQTFTIN